jgi:PHP family Zn ribbon phosphoesterase
MIPPLIVREALDRGIQLIAITDHNSSKNIESVMLAAEGTPLCVLPGMELQTVEEVHVLCLFDSLEQVRSLQAIVDETLPDLKNNPDFFGEQYIVDETGEFLGFEERLLSTSSKLDFHEAWQFVSSLGGLFIPAHVNRRTNGLFSNLGLIPADTKIEALDISRHITVEDARRKYPQLTEYPLIQTGDVHMLEDFLGTTCFIIEEPTISELRMALKGVNGRQVYIASN